MPRVIGSPPILTKYNETYVLMIPPPRALTALLPAIVTMFPR